MDSDIVQAASDKPSAHRRSTLCKGFLDELRKLDHAVILTPALQREWREHLSPYSVGWFALMDRRGQVLRLPVTENEDLRQAIAATATNGERAAMLKDAHLLEGALAADKIVASLERVARERFARAARTVAAIRQIVWVNPERTDESVIVWLRRGAPAERVRMLGFRAEEG